MISKDKTYRTRLGMPVRIYATDAGGLFSVHGAIFNDGMWNGMKWTDEGKTHALSESFAVNSVDDLVECAPCIKRTVWLNVYDNAVLCDNFTTKEKADLRMSSGRLACVKVEIDCEKGEGL